MEFRLKLIWNDIADWTLCIPSGIYKLTWLLFFKMKTNARPQHSSTEISAKENDLTEAIFDHKSIIGVHFGDISYKQIVMRTKKRAHGWPHTEESTWLAPHKVLSHN